MTDAEAIVVGAGPGGASAAYHLARRGRRVLLLDRSRFPRDKSCGDGLTRYTTRLLSEMGVLARLPPSPDARGVRVTMRGRGHRDFRYPERLAEPKCGTVVPRRILDEAICERAVDAGAELSEGTLASRLLYQGDRVVGVEVRRGQEATNLRAPVVVAADGAASRLAYQAGLPATPRDRLGFAIRGYYEGIDGLTDLLEIRMPLLDVTGRYLLPSYGWVFPTGPRAANIGVGLVSRERGANLRDLFSRFLDALREDPRFRDAELRGEWRGAPLRFDFRPDRCSAPGLLLVGDAAGMVSPFTGEGIGYALESGKLAAETVDEALADDGRGEPDLTGYRRALGRRFTGYFETGRRSARRFRLIWRVLESTFHNERPLFDICRRAALFPEGIGESYARDVFDDVTPYLSRAREGPTAAGEDGRLLRADLLSIGELLIDVVREDWPFLTGLVTADETVPGIPFRPALLLLLAGRVSRARRPLLVSVGASVEVGYLAALAQVSVGEEGAGPGSDRRDGEANWGNMFAVMVGDFLLSKAYAMSADVASEVSREIAGALSRACEGHVLALRNAHNPDLTPDEHVRILRKKTAPLFELPCRLGALLGDVSPGAADALIRYGRNLGIAYQLADDVLAATGRASELGRAMGAEPREGVYGLPVLHALQSEDRKRTRAALSRLRAGDGGVDEVYGLARRSGGFEAALARVDAFAERAEAALRGIPRCAARTSLDGLAEYVRRRASRGRDRVAGEGAGPALSEPRRATSGD